MSKTLVLSGIDCEVMVNALLDYRLSNLKVREAILEQNEVKKHDLSEVDFELKHIDILLLELGAE